MRRNSKWVLSTLVIFCIILYGVTLLTTNGVLPRKEKHSSSSEIVDQDQTLGKDFLKVGPDAPIEHNNDITYVAEIVKKKAQYQKANEDAEMYTKKYQNIHRLDVNSLKLSTLNPLKQLKIPYKVVHLDFKGAPPKLDYLFSLFPLISKAGGNSLLIEYEDMFPFSGILNGTSHGKHFSENDIKSILSHADKNGLEVIPLIQTFGHLEFILKLEQFSNLREVPSFPQEICPCTPRESGWTVLKSMIDQVMKLHPNINYIHIGADEVYHLGAPECDLCKSKDTKELFLNHVIRVAKYIRQQYKVIPIIWDDMLRRYYIEELEKSEIGFWTEVMVWDYTENVDHLISPYLWPMYATIFKNIWVASAYKGAFGEVLYQVDIQRHAMNQLSWIKTISRESPRIANFRGIAITGWSRYDHFAVLCELLPPAVPSLVLSLLILKYQNLENASTHFQKLFKCDVNEEFIKLNECVWNGRDLFQSLGNLKSYESYVKDLAKEKKGWLTDYQIDHNYTSPWRLNEPMYNLRMTLSSLTTFESSLRNILRIYYDDYVIDEWIEQKIYPLKKKLKKLVDDITNLQRRKVWPRRPLLPIPIKVLPNHKDTIISK